MALLGLLSQGIRRQAHRPLIEDDLYVPCVECGEECQDEGPPGLCPECLARPVYFLELVERDPDDDK